MLLRDEWAELHQIWQGYFNIVLGQCSAELLMIQSIFMAWFAEGFVPPISQGWKSDLYQIWGGDIAQLSALPTHLLDFGYVTLFCRTP